MFHKTDQKILIKKYINIRTTAPVVWSTSGFTAFNCGTARNRILKYKFEDLGEVYVLLKWEQNTDICSKPIVNLFSNAQV